MASELEYQVPAMVAEYASSLAYSTEFNDISVYLELEDVRALETGLYLGKYSDIRYLGESICDSPLPTISGRAPELDFPNIDDADLAIGLTEDALVQAAANLWYDGYFCFTPDDFDNLFALVSSFFDASAADIEAEAMLASPPQITITENGLKLAINDVSLRLSALSEPLLDIETNIEAKLDFSINTQSSAFGLSVHDIHTTFDKIEIPGLMSSNPYAEEHVQRFVETWIVDKIEDSLQSISLFSSVFHVLDVYIFVEQLNYLEGGFELYVNLFQEGDPEVDSLPPETTAEIAPLDDRSFTFTWEANDDREGILLYAYQLDAQGWSGWTDEQSFVWTDLTDGTHLFEVKSRDRWWNEDPTPAQITFEFQPPEEPTIEDSLAAACSGCSSNRHFHLPNSHHPIPTSLIWMGLGMLAWRTSRRQSKHP